MAKNAVINRLCEIEINFVSGESINDGKCFIQFNVLCRGTIEKIRLILNNLKLTVQRAPLISNTIMAQLF